MILILPPDIEILELARDTLVARFLTLKHWLLNTEILELALGTHRLET